MRTHHGDEQIGNARTAHLAQCFELVAANAIEQQHAAPENCPLVQWIECARRSELLGVHHHFEVTRVEFFHAALEHDPATVDEHEVRQNVLDLFHLMCCHDNRATAIEVIVYHGVVELFAIQDVQAKCRLIEHEQARVDCHHDCEMQLRHHSF